MNAVIYYRGSEHKHLHEKHMPPQRKAVRRFLGETKPLAEFVEHESWESERPQLQNAVEYCQNHRATLIVARSRGLGRSENFASAVSKVPVMCIDFRESVLTTNDLNDLIERDSRERSDKLKAHAAKAKKAGVKLGAAHPKVKAGARKHKTWEKATEASIEKRRDRARRFYATVQPKIKSMRKEGHSLQRIAETLNGFGYRTSTGKLFSPTAVMRVLNYDAS